MAPEAQSVGDQKRMEKALHFTVRPDIQKPIGEIIHLKYTVEQTQCT